jgi:hypothetical protein
VTVLEGHEERLIAYLLGELSEPEQDAVEASYVGDAQAFERLLAAEEDLIDTYVAGGLPADRRLRFERHFLQASPERRERVAFARALARQAPAAVPETPRPRYTWLGVAALLTAVLIGGGWLLARIRALHDELRRAESRHADAVRQGDESARRSVELQRRMDALLEELALARQAASGAVVASVLAPGLERDSAPVVASLPPAAEWLHLRLLLADGDVPVYEVAVRKAAGEVVARAGPLVARSANRGRAVDAMVPVRSLDEGSYVVGLRGSPDGAAWQDVATYHLRVTKGR